MATLEQLIVRIEANTEQLRRQMQTGERVVSRSSNNMERSLRGLRNAFFAITGALAGGGLIAQTGSLAEEYRRLDNRLRLVTDSEDERRRLMQQIAALSSETRTSIEATTTAYFRLSRGLARYGVEGERLVSLVRTINQAIATSGATAQESEGAMVQFSQALATNFEAAGQEIRSLQEQFPSLVQAIERGLGVASGSLMQMARDGELSTERVIEALERVRGEIEGDFEETTRGLGQSWGELADAIMLAVGAFDQASGTSAGIADDLHNIAGAVRESTSLWQELGEAVNEFYRRLDYQHIDPTRGSDGGFDPFMSPDQFQRGNASGGISGNASAVVNPIVAAMSRAGDNGRPQLLPWDEQDEEAKNRAIAAFELIIAAEEKLTDEALEAAKAVDDQMRQLSEVAAKAQVSALDSVVETLQEAVEGARSLEDAVNRVTIALVRMAAQRGFEAIASFIGNTFFSGGGATSFPGKAVGGGVSGGSPYIVGERGPELFVPRAGGGTIIPNGASAGGASFSFNIDARGAQLGVAEQIQNAVPGIVQTIRAALRDDMGRGGAFAGAFGR